MLSSTGEGLDNAVDTPDATVAAPTPEHKIAQSPVTGYQPEESSKRPSGVGEKEQQAAHKRQKLNKQMINWHNEAATKNRNDERRAQAVENGRLACLQLCAKLHNTLPRELRDLVYSNIIGPYERESVKRTCKSLRGIAGSGLKFVNCELNYLERAASADLRWWLDSYTGEKVSIEIVERWYSTRTFCFNFGTLDLIPTFLKENVFSKGLEPGLLVQHVHAHISGPPFELDFSRDQTLTCQESRREKEASLSQPLEVLNRILFDNFKSTLSQIKNKNVNLYIRIPYYHQMQYLHQILETLGPIVYQLRKEGFGRIRVQHCNGVSDYAFLFDGQETLFKDRLEKLALTA